MASAPKSMQLRVKTRSGQQVIDSLNEINCLEDLKAILYSLTGIAPNRLKVLAGFPPRPLDLRDESQLLGQVFPNQRETLIVEEAKEDIVDNRKPASVPGNNSPSRYITNQSGGHGQGNQKPTGNQSQQERRRHNSVPKGGVEGVLLRRPVPANNSCLFTSVYFCLTNGEYSDDAGPRLRQIIAETVAADRDTFNEAFLGKPNREYCTWILNEDHWGGGIELAILSQFYETEMVAVDTQNARLNRFGEDRNHAHRILIIYDGIHYDPLMLEPFSNSKLSNRKVITVFPTSDARMLDMALEVAREAKAARQFTDVANFTLKCLVCNERLTGQSQAREHAKVTGHANFGEV